MSAVGGLAPISTTAAETSGRGVGVLPAARSGAGGSTAPNVFKRALGTEGWLAIGVMLIVALLIVPLPPILLDGLLALSIALSVLVLLVTLGTRDPIDFSGFPSLLLLLTLFRLGLNVSTTRLILADGYAGEVINAFGNFLIGGNVVVGLVIFLILVVINFMVITKGAGRIAEVAARFTLDAMPGKQMAIDADLGAGLIDEAEARRRRTDVARYADFYGAMDGAAKFVRGDAVAGLIITAINLVGGFAIGMMQQGLSASDAITRYSGLSIGDGLVSQIPALIVSTSAGIITTYGASSPGVGQALGGQLTRNPRALGMSAGVLVLLAILPGLPALPFLALAGAAGAMAWAGRRPSSVMAPVSTTPSATVASAVPGTAQMRELLQVEPIEVELGYALIPLVDEAQ